MAEEKKLFLLDAFALIYRAYFGFGNNQRYNSKGVNTSAALGFTNTLLEVLKNEKPTHIAVVFDAPSTTVRHETFSEYKAGRQEMPEDIRGALPIIKSIIEAFNIPILLSEGYEADDVIGTLAKKAEKKGFKTFMMTPDKDFGQLVSENIFMYKPAKSGKPAEVLGVKEVCEKFEITHPDQVVDILGLWGDAVDNIPGIPGIGEKTAKKLIKEYGSLENLIANAEDLKGKQKENVIHFAEQGILSKQLATIILDAPVDFDEKSLQLEQPNKEALHEIFADLEFRTLAKRYLGEEISISKPITEGQLDLFGQLVDGPAEVLQSPEAVEETPMVNLSDIKSVTHDYKIISSSGEIANLVSSLKKQKSFCFDTETTGLDDHTAEIVGLSISFKNHEAYYIPISENQDDARAILSIFKDVFESETIEKVAHNIKYDINILARYDIKVKGPLFDTMIAHYLFQPDMRHNMDLLSETFLNYKPVSIETLIGKKGKNQLSMRDVELEKIKEYAGEDADVTWQLKGQFEPKIKDGFVKNLFYEIEMPLTKVLSTMEMEGINLDVQALADFSVELGTDLDRLQKDILRMAETEFNIDSPKQLGQVLFEQLKIVDKPKKTKTGQYSTSEDVLDKLRHNHDIIPYILEYRSTKKLKSTYVDPLPELINPHTERLHTSYMQTVAATGRLSSNNPNLQNIPIRTPRGREIRKAFIPRDDDFVLMAADYSQIELRIIAAMSKDENMIAAFESNQDIHRATAAKVFGVSLDKVDRDMRSKAKAVNFGMIYGQSAFGLSQTIGIKRGEAKEIIDNYFKQYHKLKTFMDGQVEFAKQNGYVETLLGRRRYLKDINSNNAVVRGHAERNAINAPIQGTAADIIKKAMIKVQSVLEKQNFKSKMLLQVHDELVFDAHKSEIEKLKEMVIYEMENAFKMEVHLKVDVGVGNNWLEAH